MGWKIQHRHREQQLPFPGRAEARTYAEQHGGLDRWYLEPAQHERTGAREAALPSGRAAK
ncbi:hypothetical protein FNH05_34500 [Amycolatopsis rhizosphaerae]|uniref:Uncharacterized protein n=1 Tax=Amycolatopsis rhizosphaerae TaxID=2053003 RepID=A0A558A858_9PSEU|nr:hypothetical protein [Amycolatopsis rhizosphaerae]TVT20443.1 hypothetical protein FNH05_34500 [Amycolatopsis rhizosphaerae]